MKDGIHPDYREVVFQDVSADFTIITRTTANSKQTSEIDGKEYPLIRVDISAASHPFYTGKEMFLDTAGRVEKFTRKFGGNYFQNKKK